MSRHSETEGARPPPEASLDFSSFASLASYLAGQRARRLGGDYLVEGLRARLPIFPVFSSAGTPEKPREARVFRCWPRSRAAKQAEGPSKVEQIGTAHAREGFEQPFYANSCHFDCAARSPRVFLVFHSFPTLQRAREHKRSRRLEAARPVAEICITPKPLAGRVSGVSTPS